MHPPPQLKASRRLALLDERRIPYAPRSDSGGGWQRLHAGRPGAELLWHAAERDGTPVAHRVWGIPFWGQVAGDAAVRRLAAGLAGHWQRESAVVDSGGAVRSWVWHSAEGGTLLPFDPDEIVANYRSERYVRLESGAGAFLRGGLRRAYYRARPLIPRPLQIAARRTYRHVQDQAAFPRWPAETSLHDLCDLLLERVVGVAGAPVPTLAAWPRGRTWALVLTHDVETAVGRDAISRVRSVEAQRGVVSSWNLVPERYDVPDELLARLRTAGCEIGVHGLKHDGRDLESARTFDRRLPEMRRWAERWGATGFRSPALHRVWERMPLLGFDYDSSYPDTDPYEPMPGGCCTWLPFFNGPLVELPVTLPQDHTLFRILRVGDAVWHEKAALLRRRGGMALLDTHPDYLLEDAPLRAYARFLDAFATDADAWTALPAEASEWWRRRAATRLEFVHGAWRAAGPAAGDAAVELLAGPRESARTPAPASSASRR